MNIINTKICTNCNQHKPITEFYQAKINKNGSICYQGRCKSCMNVKQLERYHMLPIELKRKRAKLTYDKLGFKYFKNGRLFRNYGITLDEFDIMYKNQNGKCHLCQDEIIGREVKVDHCHMTGKVRKLLCHQCNTSLGLLKEDPELFYRAAEYLKEYN